MNAMGSIGAAVAWIAGVVVLIKLFQKGGFLKGILGLIFMPFTYFWGWKNASKEEYKLKTWMWAWTIAIILGVVLAVVGAAQGAGG